MPTNAHAWSKSHKQAGVNTGVCTSMCTMSAQFPLSRTYLKDSVSFVLHSPQLVNKLGGKRAEELYWLEEEKTDYTCIMVSGEVKE